MKELMSIINNSEKDILDVINNAGEKAIVKIENRLGNILKLIEAEEKMNRIDISDIPVGSYFITLSYGSFSKTTRFIKN